MIDFTYTFQIIAIIGFTVLLVLSLYMLCSFYVCDSHNCRAFNIANSSGNEPGSTGYISVLLNETFNDGIWPIPYIGAACATPLIIWLLGIPMTVRTFGLTFLIIFLVIYFMFSFFGHHYVRPINNYIQEQLPTK